MQPRYKYPRTPHLPFSQGATSDDKILKSLAHFEGKQIVITEKMDGENTTLYADGHHARSIDSKRHESRDHLGGLLYPKAHLFESDLRICGENLYAKHSLTYEKLESYFLMFSAWKGNTCLSWAETLELAAKLEFATVPVLYQGEFSEKTIKELVNELDLIRQEGLVVRLAERFDYSDFGKSVAKWVRANHVESDTHWMHQTITRNKLKIQ